MLARVRAMWWRVSQDIRQCLAFQRELLTSASGACNSDRVAWEGEGTRSNAASELEPASYAERVAAMEVEVFVVDIKGAADADLAGLINPLLHCFQNCVFNVNVWAMPAVEARCALHCHPCSDTRPVKPGQELC